MVQIADDEIKVSAGAAFKGDKMVGWVSELEVEAIKLIRGLYLGGVITVSAPEHEQGIVIMEVTSAKSKITPVINGDEVGFTIDITLKGGYAEDVNLHTHGQLDDSFMEKLENAYENEVQRTCLNTINRMQQDSNADVFRFNQILQTEEPAKKKKVSEHWRTIYPYVDVNVNVDVSLQNLGLVQ